VRLETKVLGGIMQEENIYLIPWISAAEAKIKEGTYTRLCAGYANTVEGKEYWSSLSREQERDAELLPAEGGEQEK
jgi:hypothetical protein